MVGDHLDREGGPVQRRLHMHFWHRPVEVLGEDGKVTGMRFERTRLDEDGELVGTGEMVDYDLGAVYRAVGYHGSELPGVPYDARRGVILNQAGRVTEADGSVIPGAYANGWIKRGPVGLIGHTKGDALETITNLVEDANAGVLAQPTVAAEGGDEVLELLEARGIRYTTWDGWLALDAHERALGEEFDGPVTRERVKVVPRDEQVEVSRSGALVAG